LNSKEEIKKPLELEDIFSGRFLRGISEIENEIRVRVVYCRLNCRNREIRCEWCGEIVKNIVERYWQGSRFDPSWLDDMISRSYKEVDIELGKLFLEKGEKRARRYYGRTNPYI
jgi:hypothetical protein